ncbi:MAG: SDR family oxidoreductase [Clostridia bacterium]|nr:SDR family oxidoreductase [Clostridia bacterium]
MKNLTAVVTGASRGIGRCIAKTFAENGYNVVINYSKSEQNAIELKKELNENGFNCEIFKADVGNYEEANALIDFCIEKYGKVDVLVNNAGISQIKLFTDITPEDWNCMLHTNLTGVFNCTQCAIKEMVRNHSGNIINVSSIWGQTGASCEVHYSAVKAGVIGMTKALAKEMGLSGIRVNCIAPGVIMTDMMKDFSNEELDAIKEEIPLNQFGTPQDIADLALFIASDKAKNITGQVIASNGGMVI